jgi:two-component system phosphate regulon response regulator PhoB
MADKDAGKKRILVVDDETDVVTYLVTLLQDNGYATDTAKDGNEAMDRVKANKPDLITLDLSMPEKSGVKFYREVKGDPDLAKIPVVMVTAVTGYADSSEVYKKFISTRKQVPPPDGFIPKPIDQQEMLKTIQALLSK